MRKAFVVTEAIVLALIGLVGVIVGAIAEKESGGSITKVIYVDRNTTVQKDMKEKYPEIIFTDK